MPRHVRFASRSRYQEEDSHDDDVRVDATRGVIDDVRRETEDVTFKRERRRSTCQITCRVGFTPASLFKTGRFFAKRPTSKGSPSVTLFSTPRLNIISKDRPLSLNTSSTTTSQTRAEIPGKLHRPMDICPIRLRYELDFWRIPTHYMSPCCMLEENNNLAAKARNEKAYADSSLPASCFEKVWCGPARLKFYRLLENPRSSTGAKVFSFASAFFVLLSLLGLILSSMPELQDHNKEPHYVLHWLEMLCMVYFTLEYIARLVVNPRKGDFIRSPLNIIDLLTILPFMIEAFNELQWMKEFRGAMLVVRVMRLARVARIFKLARYSTGLRAFGETMKKSAAELSMLGMFLVTGIMLFSTAIYFFERDEPNSKFYSIPAACWWCVITMTTVGYGDLVPVTAGGKVVAALASVCGIIVLAFPISMIIDKFAESTGGWNGSYDEEEHVLPGSAGSAKKKSKRYVGF
ncbi:unnamed protein product [Caenorhabditis auriculariae]|uniref:Ion transport domain-containing protein n=1 Tax=Caenorhabditis auriculariae TaxID=2777116 RepID=A0A8S1HXM0_9PELO|nr:unnamed protein product [Caenorhabditis auriculariae]